MKTSVVSKSRFLTGIVILIATLTITASCSKSSGYMSGMGGNSGGGGGVGPGTNEVWIQGSAFNPSTITVAAGTTITWTNMDPMAHTVTSTTGAFDSGSIGSSGIYHHTFIAAGTYPYKCTVHPTMTASVTVN